VNDHVPAGGAAPADRSETPGLFEQEIREQPACLERLVRQGRAGTLEVAERLRAFGPCFVVIVARGSSDNVARYAQYLFGIRHGLTVALATPSVQTRYGASPSLGGALVVGVSQSGRSPDLLAVIEEGRRQGALTLAVTNDSQSALAQAAELRLPLLAGEERAVAATKTYANQLLAFAMLSAALQGDEEAWGHLGALPEAVAAAIAENTSPALPEYLQETPRLAVLGRGYNFSTAFEVALKVKETSYVMAEPYSFADFLHGPVAMVDPSLPLVVIAPSGRTDEDADAAVELAHRLQAPLAVVSDRAGLLAEADCPLPLPKAVPEWLSPIVAVVPGQLLGLALAESRGLDPDQPRGLSKVTRTL
jgi:glucosamine--fructose-6-phosphate aminotransferase (isomerizing)